MGVLVGRHRGTGQGGSVGRRKVLEGQCGAGGREMGGNKDGGGTGTGWGAAGRRGVSLCGMPGDNLGVTEEVIRGGQVGGCSAGCQGTPLVPPSRVGASPPAATHSSLLSAGGSQRIQ